MCRITSTVVCTFALVTVLWSDSAFAQCSGNNSEQISDDCGDTGFEGCCTIEGTSQWCENDVLCEVRCMENADPALVKCGWDDASGFYDCGGHTQPDPSCVNPWNCPGECVPCGNIVYEGCCDGQTLTWCECGCIRTIDCSQNTPPGDTCGWLTDPGFYDCGQLDGDPSGAFPIDCDKDVPCVPDCTGKDCGDDGCGLSCGTCDANYFCDGNDQCAICTCMGKECGDDGCGGSCGTCTEGYSCQGGTCVGGGTGACGADPTETCQDYCGEQGAGGCYCDEACVDYGDCCPDYESCCSGTCTPDCVSKDCGDDGCGGSCGTCTEGYSCQGGTCVKNQVCVPDCAGKDCGDDGCGGSCGTCTEGYSCQGGTCVKNQVCVPDCTGKDCGDDGCEGVCGVCVPPKKCNETGTCFDPGSCTPDCAGRECGDDKCGATCGSCTAGQECNAQGICIDVTVTETDVIGPPPTDTGAGTDTGGSQCPPGYVLFYGTCKLIEDGTDPGGSAGSDCAAGAMAQPPSTFALVLVTLLGLCALRIRRSPIERR